MRYLLSLLGLTALLATAACETVEGAGQDITTAGQAVTAEAQKAK